jgi:hypothetical protein
VGEAFGQAGLPWKQEDREDRGDGIFVLQTRICSSDGTAPCGRS